MRVEDLVQRESIRFHFNIVVFYKFIIISNITYLENMDSAVENINKYSIDLQ